MTENSDQYPKFPFDATKVIIYGGGGLSKMIIETVRALSVYQIVGIIDDNMEPGKMIIGSPILGSVEILPDLYKQGIRTAVNSVGGIGNYKIRLNVFQQLANAGFICPAIVHPTAHIDPSARLEAGVLVLAQSYVSGSAVVGMGTLINNSVVISHDCILGVCSNFSPGAMIAGDAVIGDFTQIGMNATVNIGVKVGRECLIGNGATIKANIPDGTRVHAGAIWPPFQPDKFNTLKEA
jgi:acetyltransferase EpsM